MKNNKYREKIKEKDTKICMQNLSRWWGVNEPLDGCSVPVMWHIQNPFEAPLKDELYAETVCTSLP